MILIGSQVPVEIPWVDRETERFGLGLRDLGEVLHNMAAERFTEHLVVHQVGLGLREAAGHHRSS